MIDIKDMVNKLKEDGKPTSKERELLIKSLLLQAKLHNQQVVVALGLLFRIAAQEIEALQAENAELKKRVNIAVRKVLAEIGTELEEDKRIAKKSMPFVRAIVLNKIQEFPPPPPKGE